MIYMPVDRIVMEAGKRGGKPCIRGTRIAVHDVLGWMAAGIAQAEILADFPELEAEDIRACLAFAAQREPRISRTAPGRRSSSDAPFGV